MNSTLRVLVLLLIVIAAVAVAMLPSVIRALGLANAGRRERDADRMEETLARRQALEAADRRLAQRELDLREVQITNAQSE